VDGDANLFQIVCALSTPRCFARRLHGRQKQRNQHTDDRDHDQ
jgi:hypothetical protein